jgi:SAM-dependent methyltransferase
LAKVLEKPVLRLVSALLALRMWLLRQPAFTSTVLPAIPRPVRWLLRRLFFLPVDAVDRLFGRGETMVPPMAEIFAGSVDGFRASGDTLVHHLVEFAGLEPSTKILDIGSGMGRLAVPLTEYLSVSGSYDGLDIVESGVAWCNEHIASEHQNFRFHLADVFNKEYNPRGRFQASEYRFPYADESFDLAILISVFTHMLPADMEHYVSEIGRVLKPGGRCFATYFLVNDDSRRLMEAGESSLRFKHDLGTHWVVTTKVPELSVGYEETYARSVYDQGRRFSEVAVHYGGWCGREPFWSHESGLGDQDVVVATRG